MGTRLTQQKRGKGGPAYASPGHRFFGRVQYEIPSLPTMAQVVDFIDDPGRTTLIAELLLEDGRHTYMVAPEGLSKNDLIELRGSTISAGNVIELKHLTEGTPVFNIEAKRNDGGTLVRSSGVVAYVAGKNEEANTVTLRLASKELKELSGDCLATIGIAAGGGRDEKPFKKAGSHYHAAKARNKYYPHVRGTAMSAYDHPHGGKSLGKPSTVSRHTPPGRKVGHVAASRTGRRRGRIIKKTIEGASKSQGGSQNSASTNTGASTASSTGESNT